MSEIFKDKITRANITKFVLKQKNEEVVKLDINNNDFIFDIDFSVYHFFQDHNNRHLQFDIYGVEDPFNEELMPELLQSYAYSTPNESRLTITGVLNVNIKQNYNMFERYELIVVRASYYYQSVASGETKIEEIFETLVPINGK